MGEGFDSPLRSNTPPNTPTHMNTPSRTRRPRRTRGAYGHTPMRMNDSVYALRRQVIDIIYEANRRLQANGHPRLPRQEVRIVDGGEANILGYAWMGKNIVHIPKRTCEGARDTATHTALLYTTLHELLHSVLAVEHTETCPLMSTYHDYTVTDEQAWKLFLGYFE